MSDDFKASIDDAALRFLYDNWFVINNTAFRQMANDAVDEAKANIDPSRSGLHNRSFNLQKSIRLTRYIQLSPEGGGEATITAGSKSVPYAAIHEKGGIIKAKAPNKYLRFQVNGHWFSKKEVRIPARPYLQPAIDAVSDNYDDYLKAALDKIMNEAL